MPIVADAAVKVAADMAAFNADLKAGGEKGTRTLGQQLKGAFSPKNLAIAGVAGGVALAGAITAGLAGAVKALIDIERLNAQTDAVIRSTGGVANVTRQGIEDMSEALERTTTIERETTQEAANMLLTFTKVHNEVGKGNDIFDQATQSALDMSVALGTDAKSAAMLLGKALNDPVKGMTAMTRAGIQFTAQQKEMIAALVESGDVLGAQKIILAELETQFGGSAEAFANTKAGKIQRFQNDVGNMFESIVLGAVKVSDAIGAAAEATGDILATEILTLEGIGDAFAGVFGGMGDDAEDGMQRVFSSVEDNMGYSADVMRTRGDEIKANWQGVADFIPQAIRDRWDDVRAAGFQQQVEYAKGLLDAQNNVKVAIEAALQIVTEEMTKQEEINYLSGQRGTLMLARGIASAEGKTASVAAIDGALALLRQRLGELGVEFYTSGRNLGLSFAAGIESTANFGGVVRTASGKLAQAVRGQIGIRSEPTDPDSPLRGITKWGGNIVKTIAEGIYGSLGTGAGAAKALAGVLVPSFGASSFGLATAGATSGAGGVTNQWIVNIDGVERTVSTAEEAIAVLQDLGAFGEGRLSG